MFTFLEQIQKITDSAMQFGYRGTLAKLSSVQGTFRADKNPLGRN